MELLIEVEDEVVMYKVHECVANIGHVLVVDGDVEEIILALVVLVDLLEEQPLVVLVRDMFDHDGCPHVIASLDPFDVHNEVDMIRAQQRRFRVVVLDALMRLLQGTASLLDALVRDIEG